MFQSCKFIYFHSNAKLNKFWIVRFFSWNEISQIWPVLGISVRGKNIEMIEMIILGGNCMLSFKILIIFFKKNISLIAAIHIQITICKTFPNLGGSNQAAFFMALTRWGYWWTVSFFSLRNGRIRINDYFGKHGLNHYESDGIHLSVLLSVSPSASRGVKSVS